jgi:integrase
MPRARALPPYIIKQRNVCFARVTIPRPVQPIFGGKQFFKASTHESDPRRAAAKAAPWIAEWHARIEQARTACSDPIQARIAELTYAYSRYRSEPLDDAGAALLRDAFLFLANDPSQLATLANQPDMRLALPAPAVRTLDQITGHATPFLTNFAEWQQVTPRTGDTLKMYVRDIQEFARLTSVTLETLDQSHVYDWAEKLAAGGNTPETIRRKVTSLNAYWRWLVRKKYVDGSRRPFTGLQIDDPRNGAERAEAKRIRWPTKVVPTLWQLAEQEGRIVLSRLIRIGAYTGGRIESLATLMVDSVRFDPDTDLRFLHFSDKTEAGVRDVPLHSEIAALIDELIANAGPDGYLFPISRVASRKGNAYGVAFGQFKRRHGYDDHRLVFHSLRKTIAHLLESAECPEGVAQDICGHVKKGVTFGLYSGQTRLDQRQFWLEKAVRYE